MQCPPIIDRDLEMRRLASLAGFGLLDTPPEDAFDTIVALARRLLDCPIALVALLDDHRQWMKAKIGLEATEVPRDLTFCSHTIYADDIMVVEDATRDARFADNPFVTGEPGVRFYAGVPLRPVAMPSAPDPDLPGIGTLCVVDTRPRTLDAEEAAILRGLAGLVATLIEARAATETAQRLSQQAVAHAGVLDRANRQLSQAERIAGIGSWRLDLADGKVEWSDQVYVIHGLPIGKFPTLDDALIFYPGNEQARLTAVLDRAAQSGEPFEIENDFITADGRPRRVRSIGEPELVDGRPVAIIGVFQDVTERYAHEQALRHTASTDSLTGLANRRCFEARLDAALARARSANEPLALLILDIDRFKSINDGLGHDAGDEVLRGIADRLRGTNFANAFAARLGGDEFVVLVTRPRDCAAIEAFVAAILRECAHRIERAGDHRLVSATVGAALFGSGVRSPADLLRRADLALYEAKRDARGTGRLYGSSQVIHAAADDAPIRRSDAA